jgi:hypothetical protein
MHHYSPSPRWLAVPGIGFPQNISIGPDALDLEDFWDRPVPPIQKISGLPKGLLGIFAAVYTYDTYPPAENRLRSRRFLSATRSRSTFRGKRTGNCTWSMPDGMTTRSLSRTGYGKARRRWKGGPYPLAGGARRPPFKN